MMRASTLKTWAWLHKWSSLVCTLFMLLLCLTGLPLIFHEEIDQLTGAEIVAPALDDPAQDAARVSLDRILAAARARYPERVVQYSSPDEDDDRVWYVTLTPSPAPTTDYRSVAVDARNGEVLGELNTGTTVMSVMLRLHTDLFAGLPGELFLGFMGLLLVVAIVSGVVLYAPFMRKLEFGDVRRDRKTRTRWLDLHNLLGIVTLVWALVVGLTGVINTLALPLTMAWQNNTLAPLLASYRGQPLTPEAQRAPMQRALEAAKTAAPGMKLSFIAFPGTLYSSPQHDTFFMQGDQPLTAHLLQPVMVDARSAAVTAVPALPWYLTALSLSRPLHFGDYGGLFMKLLWALLDVITIVVLGSGLYLWLAKPRTKGSAADRYDRLAISESPKPEQETWVAPSIWRAKS